MRIRFSPGQGGGGQILLLLLLYRMLPDITSKTWAKKHFYNFL
jgi:hypothetical protein